MGTFWDLRNPRWRYFTRISKFWCFDNLTSDKRESLEEVAHWGKIGNWKLEETRKEDDLFGGGGDKLEEIVNTH